MYIINWNSQSELFGNSGKKEIELVTENEANPTT